MRVFYDKLTGVTFQVTNSNLYSIYDNAPDYEEVKEEKKAPVKKTKSK